MEILKLVLAVVFLIAGLIGWIVILIDAFQDEIWKGILGLLCGLYLLYFALFEFEHDNKWIVIVLAFGGNAIAAGLLRL